MTEPASTATPIRADIGKPTTAHQQLWNQIDDRIAAAVEPLAPRMGTVTGIDGGKVLVTLDNEKDDRLVSLPRRKGVRYLPGDRVFVHQLHGGDEVIGGIVSSKAGVDPAVDSNQIFTGAIKQTHLSSASTGGAAVGPGELQNQAVQRVHLAPEVSGDITNANNAGLLGQTLATNAQNSANAADTKAQNARTRADLAVTNAATAQSAATAADAHAQNVYDLLNGGAANGNTAYNDIHAGGNSILKRLAALEAYNTAHP